MLNDGADPAGPPPVAGVREEWRQGKMLLLAVSFGVGLSAIPSYSLGVFVEPLSKEFGWPISQIFLAQAMMSLIVGLGAPAAGLLLDRVGARPLALAGTVMISAGMGGLALLDGSIAYYFLMWAVMAIAICMCSAIIWLKAVVDRFHLSRGLAVSVALCGSNIAGSVTPMIAAWTNEAAGMHVAYAVLGAYMLLTTLPLAWLYYFDSHAGTRSGGTNQTAGGRPYDVSSGRTPREALRTASFWVMSASFFLASLSITSFTVGFIPMLTNRGLDPLLAASAVSSLSLAAIGGRLAAGSLMDNWFAPRLAMIALSLPLPGIALLLYAPPTYGIALAAAILIGLSIGAEFNMISFLVSRYFGLRSYGTISGLMYGAFTLGAVAGPPLTAKAFETYGNYHYALVGLAACFAAAAVLMLFCGRYPDFGKGETLQAVQA